MQKLRQSYSKYQSQVFADNPRYISSQKVQTYVKIAEDQMKLMQNKNDYKDYQQALFYQQRFSKLAKVASNFNNKKIESNDYHRQVRQVLQKDYKNVPYNSNIRAPVVNVINKQQNFKKVIKQQPIHKSGKSPIKDFFDQQQIKNTKKATFSDILRSNQVPLKYGGLKSVNRSKVIGPNNSLQLKQLQRQNQRLKNLIQKLQKQKNKTGNNQLDQDSQKLLKSLHFRVRELDSQNRRLKQQVYSYIQSEPMYQQIHDPYNMPIRQNNIQKINNKNLAFSQKNSQFDGSPSELGYTRKGGNKIYYDRQRDMPSNGLHQNRHRNLGSAYNNKDYIQEQNDNNYLHNTSASTIQTQFLNLQNTQLYDLDQNQICRQKIAFFKKSMIIIKDPQFDIAFKRSDFNQQMDKLRIILYVNNKVQRRLNLQIDYQYDHQDYNLNVKKKLKQVEPRRQGRQQIQINLKNTLDLGSLITAKFHFGDRIKKIIVPALFINFDPEYKYQFQNNGYIQRNLALPLIIKPMSQFTNIDKSNNVLDLTQQYLQNNRIGKLYGKSKNNKGVVKLSWKNGNKLQIQTCQQWRTLMGYLFLNAEQTKQY